MKRKVIALFLMFCILAGSLGMPCKGVYAYEEMKEIAGMEESPEGEKRILSSTGQAVSVEAPSALLMEASTGTVLYEKAAKEQLRPASITKIMTLILIFDAIRDGKIKLEDTVTTSEYAASMGGSQVFLEAGEQQTVDTMIKCIAVASANDACVAMAEHVWGSEEAFVAKMNERAKGLGMEQTHFVNCCGLDVDGHVTSAYDVALMSRELITKYPQIHSYSTIWMETITHTTKKGTSEFGLTNTNKLIRQYEYATGLKTGSTGLAKYCVSATAEKDHVNLIAVIMAAPDYKVRFRDAATLLNYGFANCTVYRDENMPELKPLSVKESLKKQIALEYAGDFSYLSMDGKDVSAMKRKLVIKKSVQAPVKKGDVLGQLEYYLDGKKVGSVAVRAKETAEKSTLPDCYRSMWKKWAL